MYNHENVECLCTRKHDLKMNEKFTIHIDLIGDRIKCIKSADDITTVESAVCLDYCESVFMNHGLTLNHCKGK